MNNSERIIIGIYYAIGGIILGLGIAIYSSLYHSLTTSSFKIVIFTVITCFVIGYLFPNIVNNIFRWIWKLFTN
mgnify:CR=1 FL=1|jgi:VIT1/CCC1 family predicted Fe2+/Mn2+ transporter